MITLLCFGGAGEIPASIGQLTNLTYLGLNYNQLSGKQLTNIVHIGWTSAV